MITLGLGDRHYHSGHSDRVSYIYQEFKKPGKGGRTSKIKCVYIGCDRYLEAKRIAERYRGSRVFVRQSERSVDWDWEVKIQGDFELSQLDAIATQAETALVDRGSGRGVVPFPVDGDRKAANQSDSLRRYYSKEDWRKRSLFC